MYVEPKQSVRYKATLSSYMEEVVKNKKAVFMGVCWGKFAEGIDFSDEAARACIIVGVPNP